MTNKILYGVGLTNICWGLFLIRPLYLRINTTDTFILVPIIVIFLLTGLANIKGRSFSWTLNVLLCVLAVLTIAATTSDNFFNKSDYRTYDVFTFAVVTIAIILSLLSFISIVMTHRQAVVVHMKVNRFQKRLTWIIGGFIGTMWMIYLLHSMYWF